MSTRNQYWFPSRPPIDLDVEYHVKIGMLIWRPNFFFPYLIACNPVKIQNSIWKFFIYFEVELVQSQFMIACQYDMLLLWSGSSLTSFTLAYSANSTGLDFLRSFRETQSTETSFHSTNSLHLQVILLWCRFPLIYLIISFTWMIFLSSLLCSITSINTWQ